VKKIAKLPRNKLDPAAIRGLPGTDEGWFYVNGTSIDVFAYAANKGSLCVRITKQQLQKALAVMAKRS
jgi:hypothetical protein